MDYQSTNHGPSAQKNSASMKGGQPCIRDSNFPCTSKHRAPVFGGIFPNGHEVQKPEGMRGGKNQEMQDVFFFVIKGFAATNAWLEPKTG